MFKVGDDIVYSVGDKVLITSVKFPSDDDDEISPAKYHCFLVGDVGEVVDTSYDDYYEMRQYKVQILNPSYPRTERPHMQYLFGMHMQPVDFITNRQAKFFLSQDY